jgi:hypothetical protein
VNCFHCMSCWVGLVRMFPLCLPIRAMSLLKSFIRMCLLLGLLCMWLNMVFGIICMCGMSSI